MIRMRSLRKVHGQNVSCRSLDATSDSSNHSDSPNISQVFRRGSLVEESRIEEQPIHIPRNIPSRGLQRQPSFQTTSFRRSKKRDPTNKILLIVTICSFFGMSILTFLLLHPEYQHDIRQLTKQWSFNSVDSITSEYMQSPKQCTIDQLKEIRRQLDPKACAETGISRPFQNYCSLTKATSCPDTTNYLEEYYHELQEEYINKKMKPSDIEPFVGISVGCNKGYDALDIFRMGTFDRNLKKADWKSQMDTRIAKSRCGQDKSPSFEVDERIKIPRRGQMHCIEPILSTIARLKSVSARTGYERKGFNVVYAALDDRNWTAKMPFNKKLGSEENGLDEDCNSPTANQKDCEKETTEVDVMTLQQYVSKNVPDSSPIHVLHIDVEGYDANVILGAGKDILERVEFLQFEYNWKAAWKLHHLVDIIDLLDENEFTCYWAGKDQRLWRITGCFMLYYDIKVWSNIVCVNRRRNQALQQKMERVFEETLRFRKSYRTRVLYQKLKLDVVATDALSTDVEMMTSKYLKI